MFGAWIESDPADIGIVIGVVVFTVVVLAVGSGSGAGIDMDSLDSSSLSRT